jgi:hypothetical protein
MKKSQNIQQLRKRFGIRDHWGVSDSVVQQMAECRWFNPRIPPQAASNHALRPTLHSEFYRESAVRMARLVEEQPEAMSVFVLGQIIEYHMLADWLSGNQNASH